MVTLPPSVQVVLSRPDALVVPDAGLAAPPLLAANVTLAPGNTVPFEPRTSIVTGVPSAVLTVPLCPLPLTTVMLAMVTTAAVAFAVTVVWMAPPTDAVSV